MTPPETSDCNEGAKASFAPAPCSASAYQRQYYLQNAEKIKARARKWRLENRERDNARHREYRKAHPQMEKKYYQDNAEAIKARAAEWAKQNRPRVNRTKAVWRGKTDSWRPLARRKAKIQQVKKNEMSKQKATFSYQLWDDAQDAYLVEHRGTQTNFEMAEALGRTYYAIRRRIGRLGLGQNAGISPDGEQPVVSDLKALTESEARD